jgi:uncharacterized membrane protein
MASESMERVGTHSVVALFATHDQAEAAIRALRDLGINRDDISLVARDKKGKPTGRETVAGTQERSTDGTSIGENIAGGAVFGALGGLLLELAALAIPGIGPIVAAGPLATTLAGAGFGALGGGIIGAIKDMGVPDDEAHIYAESIRRGDTMVSVRTDGTMIDRVMDVLNQHGAVDVDERANSLRTGGWNKFDDKADIDATDYSWPTADTTSRTTTTSTRVRSYPYNR